MNATDQRYFIGRQSNPSPLKGKHCHGEPDNLLSILRSNSAPGRTYALHSTDEFVPDAYNYNDSDLHVVGQITCDPNGANKKKLGVYTTWESDLDSPEHATVNQPTHDNVEFYDLTSDPDEKTSLPYDSPEVTTAMATLFGGSQWGLLYSELQARLPDKYQPAQTLAYQQPIEYMKVVNEMADKNTQNAAAARRSPATVRTSLGSLIDPSHSSEIEGRWSHSSGLHNLWLSTALHKKSKLRMS